MQQNPDDICVRPGRPAETPTRPVATPIWLTSVWECQSTDEAEQLLAGTSPGYVYQRDKHPNGDLLAERCRTLHDAEGAWLTSSGMAAIAVGILSQVNRGDHIVASRELYGRTLRWLTNEAERLGVQVSFVDTCDLQKTESAMQPTTKLLIAETISNPMLQVADVGSLAELAHARGARLLVDNTFATPILCRPLTLGADWVVESVSKMMNGHSDVMLGLLAGRGTNATLVCDLISTWGFNSSPFDCWLAERGMATLPLRVERTNANALSVAMLLQQQNAVVRVDYPGLATHPHHKLAQEQFEGGYGSIVSFRLDGGRAAADRFISRVRDIPFAPSLGEVATTLSHPDSTSHRGLTTDQKAALGIDGGTIRLSVGLESEDFLHHTLLSGLRGH